MASCGRYPDCGSVVQVHACSQPRDGSQNQEVFADCCARNRSGPRVAGGGAKIHDVAEDGADAKKRADARARPDGQYPDKKKPVTLGKLRISVFQEVYDSSHNPSQNCENSFFDVENAFAATLRCPPS